MDNKNNIKKNSNDNQSNPTLKSKSKSQSQMTMFSFIVLITIGMILITTLISHFENEPDTEKDGSKYLKPIVCFSLVGACIYLVYKNMNSKKISLLGYKTRIDRGLFIYMFIIMMFAFLI